MDQDKFMSFGQWDEMSAKDHYRKVMRGGRGKGFVVSTPIDRDRYPNREKQGLEGPYKSRKSGKIFYYDKKAGKYYDPDSDMYLDVSDVMEELAESRGQQKAMDAAVKRGRKSDSNGTMVITAGKDGKGRVFYATSIDRVHGDILKVGTDKSKAVKLTKGNAAKYVRGKATFVKAVNVDDEIDKTKKISDAELKKLVGEENDDYDPRLGEMNIGESTPAYRKMMKNYAGSDMKKVFDILKPKGFRVGEQDDTLVRNMLKKHKNNVKKAAAEIEKRYSNRFESVELDEATRHTVHVETNRAGYRRLEKLIASLDGYQESEFEKEGKATFTFDANKHDGSERKKVAEFIKKTAGVKFSHAIKEEDELEEGSARDKRMMKSVKDKLTKAGIKNAVMFGEVHVAPDKVKEAEKIVGDMPFKVVPQKKLKEAWTGETVLRNAEIGSKSGYGINIKKRGAVTKTPYKHMLMTKSTGKKIKVRFDHGKKEFVGTAEEVADHLNKILGISEDAAVNNVGDGNVKGFDPMMGKNPRKRKKFAGCEVFEVTPETYRKCMWGKKKFEHWKRYIDLDNDEENTIREFALRNPRAGIILQNSSTGEMVYLRHKR